LDAIAPNDSAWTCENVIEGEWNKKLASFQGKAFKMFSAATLFPVCQFPWLKILPKPKMFWTSEPEVVFLGSHWPLFTLKLA
jgi:hypothetical protein